MILDYNTDPNATPEQMIQSLRDNVQLALDEQQMIMDNFSKSLLKAFGVDVRTLRREFTSFAEQMQEVTEALSNSLTELVETVGSHTEDIGALQETVGGHTEVIGALQENVNTLVDTTIPALDTRVLALEGRWTAPAAPTTDGAYKLTVTVTDGVPVYTWESA